MLIGPDILCTGSFFCPKNIQTARFHSDIIQRVVLIFMTYGEKMFKFLSILGILVLIYLVIKNFLKKNTLTPPPLERQRKIIPFKKPTPSEKQEEKEVFGDVVEVDQKEKNQEQSSDRIALSKESPFHAENLIFPTDRGEKVRSKSEAYIANTLFKLGIAYHYEYKFHGKKGDYKLPDFLFFTPVGEVIIWEHLGMLDDKNYYRHWKQKEAWYLEEGFKQDDTLFTTQHYVDNPEKGYRTIEKVAHLIKARLEHGQAAS